MEGIMTGRADVRLDALILFAFSWRLGVWLKAADKPALLLPTSMAGTGAGGGSASFPNRIDRIVAKCPSLHSVYYPSFLFLNAHLQLMSFMINCHIQEYYLRPFVWVTELVTLLDGEEVALDWIGEIPCADARSATPILMMHHGAGGRSSDLPGQSYVREALQRGWLVCALNRRGHKPGLPLSRDRWNFFGSTEDLRHVIRHFVRKKRPRARLVMLGISAGSGLVALFMGEQGERRRQRAEGGAGTGAEKQDPEHHPDPECLSSFCDAAVGVCPGFNTETCMGNVAPPYSWGMLHLQKQFLIKNEHRFGHKASYQDALAAPDLQTWLDCMWSLAHEKYSSAADYYVDHNPMRVTQFIYEPCLFLNAEDDPLCVRENITAATAQGLLRDDMNAALVLTKTGSHCCFFEFGTWPVHTKNWAERVCFEFFDAALSSTNITVTSF